MVDIPDLAAEPIPIGIFFLLTTTDEQDDIVFGLIC